MPILNRDDAQEVERRVQNIFAARDDGRGNAVRRLFVEVMDFAPDSGRAAKSVAQQAHEGRGDSLSPFSPG